MFTKFTKIFDTKNHGQILIYIKTIDIDKISVFIQCQTKSGNEASVSYEFHEHDLAQKCFDELNEQLAIERMYDLITLLETECCKCGTLDDVEFVHDPYTYDTYQDLNEYPMCSNCVQKQADLI